MQTIFDAIQKYPNEFATTAASRSVTTPSEINKRNHIALQQAIQIKNWERVKEIIKNPQYYAALNGVVYCLEQYSPIGSQVWFEICLLMDQNKIV